MPDSPPSDTKDQAISAFSMTDKVPPFWKKDPELWFCQLEALFARGNVTNSLTKFQIIIPKLDFEVLQDAADIVKKPGDSPYEDLKTRLVSTYTDSESKRIQQLLEGKQLGDEKPSQLLRHMKQLAGDVVASSVLSTVWMRALPPNIQAILISTGHSDIEKLAEIADKIHEVTNPVEVCAVSATNFPRPETSRSFQSSIASLEAKMEQLAQQVAALTTSGCHRGRDRQRSPYQNRGRSRSRSKNNPDWLCFYHYKYKEKARKCEKPCAWDKRNEKTAEN